MKNLLTTVGFPVFMALLSVSEAMAQAATEEAAVKECLQNYISGVSGDGNRLEKAFHPSASVKYLDAKTGEFKDEPIAAFIVRVKSNTTIPKRTFEIVSLNIEGNAAQAKIKIEADKLFMFDYMNLLKISGEWKIVSKIFSRKDK